MSSGNLIRILSGFAVIAFVCSSSRGQEQTANQILTRVASTYAHCTTYYDEGTVSGGLNRGKVTFRTTFVRPGHFGFEMWLSGDKDRKNAFVVWKNGETVQDWPPSNIRSAYGVREEPLDSALSRIGFFSSGSSLIIPPLLLPGAFRMSDVLTLITEAKVVGEEKVDDRPTFKIEGKMPGRQRIKLWIDKTDYLIVKASRAAEFARQPVDATVQFKPKLNARIPPEYLIFRPPAEETVSSQTGTPVSSVTRRPTLTVPGRKFGSSLSTGPRANASNDRHATEDDVIRVDTDLVVSAVLVMDKAGKIVTGLTKEDFLIKEDDNPQEVASLSMGDSKEVPRSIVLVIDYSGSQMPYIGTSIDAAKMLVDKLNPKDRMAVVTDDVRLVVDFTSDKDELKAQLERLKVSALAGTPGASDQFDAILATVTELFSPEDIRPIVIFQTDGDQLDGLKGGQPSDPFRLPRKYSLEDIVTATERSRATVYSVVSGVPFIGVPEAELIDRARRDWEKREAANIALLKARNLPLPESKPKPPDEFFLDSHARQWLRRQLAVESIAKSTGAWAEFLEQPEQADEIYNRILTDIDRRYVLGYYPTNRARDGRRRKVLIEVRGHPEYSVWGQKSYFARDER